MDDPDCYKGSSIQNLKSDLFDLKNKVELKVLEERKAVVVAVDDVAAKVEQVPEFQNLAADQKDKINRRIDSHKVGLDSVHLIPVLRDRANGARNNLLSEILAEVDRLARPATSPITPPGMDDAPVVPPQAPSYVNASQIKVAYPKPFLSEEADVDQYIEELKKTLLAEIRAGKKVIV